MTDPVETPTDVEAAIKADVDRLNVDHRTAAEAVATYYNTLRANCPSMTTEFLQHITSNYQCWLLSEDSDEDD